MNSNLRLTGIVLVMAVAGIALFRLAGQLNADHADGPPALDTAFTPLFEEGAPLDFSRGESAPASEAPMIEPPPRSISGLSIRGFVVNQDRQPIQGAAIAAYQPNLGAVRGISDADGVFEIDGLEPGRYRVSAVRQHYNEAVVNEVPAGSSAVTLILEPLSSIEGHVITALGAQLPSSVEVAYLPYPPSDLDHWRRMVRDGRITWTAIDDPEGHFVLEDVDSRRAVAAAARAEGFEPAYVTLQPIAPGDAASARIVLSDTSVILGVVVAPGGAPVAGAEVYVEHGDQGLFIDTTDADGRFTIDDMGDAPVQLLARHAGYLDGRQHVRPIRGGTVETRIELGMGGTLLGAVYRGAEPLPGQRIMVHERTRLQQQRSAVTDENGLFQIEGITPGLIQVVAQTASEAGERMGRSHHLSREAIIEAGAVTEVEFIFPEAYGAIEGYVTVNGQVPASGRVSVLTRESDGSSARLNSSFDRNGYYQIPEVTPGFITLTVALSGPDGIDRQKHVEFQLGPGELVRQDVAFDDTTQMAGRVEGFGDHRGTQVIVIPGRLDSLPDTLEGFLDLERRMAGQAAVAEDGSFRIEGLAPGTYTLLAVEFPEEAADFLASLRIGSAVVVIEEGASINTAVDLR